MHWLDHNVNKAYDDVMMLWESCTIARCPGWTQDLLGYFLGVSTNNMLAARISVGLTSVQPDHLIRPGGLSGVLR
jgi:hypothetical protein